MPDLDTLLRNGQISPDQAENYGLTPQNIVPDMGGGALQALGGVARGIGNMVSYPGQVFQAGTRGEAPSPGEMVPWGMNTALQAAGLNTPFAEAGALGSAGGKPLRMYHATRSPIEEFGPAPAYRGSTYLSPTPEGALKGAGGGALDFYSTPGPKPPFKVHAVDVPNEGISGLHWTPEEIKWHGRLPDKITGETKLDKALTDQPNNKQIPWWDLYDEKQLPNGNFEYTKKPVKEYSLDEASQTTRDIYGNQLPGYASGSDKASAERLRKQGMSGFLVKDEGGVSIAHIDPQSLKMAKYGLAGVIGAGAYHGQRAADGT